MNTRKVAAALNTISVAFGELAEALIEQPEGEAGSSPVLRPAREEPLPASADLPLEIFNPSDEASLLDEIFPDDVKAAPRGEAPQGSLLQCPKHKAAYMDRGKGKFCPARSDDPAWSNPKGYCTINPRNVDTWLRSQAAAISA